MRRKLPKIKTDEDKLAKFKEGDIIFTTNYGKCTIDFIDKHQATNSVVAKDENGKLHFVNVKQIITED